MLTLPPDRPREFLPTRRRRRTRERTSRHCEPSDGALRRVVSTFVTSENNLWHELLSQGGCLYVTRARRSTGLPADLRAAFRNLADACERLQLEAVVARMSFALIENKRLRTCDVRHACSTASQVRPQPLMELPEAAALR